MNKEQNSITFFPVYNNQYQELLYRELISQGNSCVGVNSIEEIKTIKFLKEKSNIIHIHWINMFFNENILFLDKKEIFFNILNLKKKQGFKIYWTIHNYLSHDSQDIEGEIEFRKKLYQFSDRVFVHHPLALNILDWLPGRSKVQIYEHGHYDFEECSQISRAQARKILGISSKEFVVSFIGHVKSYKGLEDSLPVFFKMLQSHPNLRILIAGKIYSQEVKEMVKNLAHSRLQIFDSFQSQEEMLFHMKAADVGFISYRSILTSGTLIHWLTCGRPVIAPDKGLIPCYVSNSWNGALYKNIADLEYLISSFLNMKKNNLKKMENNAFRTAQSLKWSFHDNFK